MTFSLLDVVFVALCAFVIGDEFGGARFARRLVRMVLGEDSHSAGAPTGGVEPPEAWPRC